MKEKQSNMKKLFPKVETSSKSCLGLTNWLHELKSLNKINFNLKRKLKQYSTTYCQKHKIQNYKILVQENENFHLSKLCCHHLFKSANYLSKGLDYCAEKAMHQLEASEFPIDSKSSGFRTRKHNSWIVQQFFGLDNGFLRQDIKIKKKHR